MSNSVFEPLFGRKPEEVASKLLSLINKSSEEVVQVKNPSAPVKGTQLGEVNNNSKWILFLILLVILIIVGAWTYRKKRKKETLLKKLTKEVRALRKRG